MKAISVEQVSRTFRSGRGARAVTVNALNNVSLSVEQGELYGLLGPNGAGKTTLIKILVTLLAPTSGNAFVHGMDVVEESGGVRPIISMVSGGENSGYGLLTVRENLWMFSQYYGMSNREARQRIDGLLERVGLLDRAGTRCSELSTGLRQKMNIVRGFLTDPLVLFLDEPTVGLDVGAARELRVLIREWLAENRRRSVFLTTHYLAEADELCDRVAIMDRGRILTCDSPAALRQSYTKGTEISVQVSRAGDGAEAGPGAGPEAGIGAEPEAEAAAAECTGILRNGADPSGPGYAELGRAISDIPGLLEMKCHPSGDGGRLQLNIILESHEVLPRLITHLDSMDYVIHEIRDRDPSLEEIFIRIVDDRTADDIVANDRIVDDRTADDCAADNVKAGDKQ